MRVLVLSSTFPNSSQPNRGVFIQERISRLAKRCDVIVVSPIPWFPFNRWLRPDRAGATRVEDQNGLTVYHPRFFSLPRYGKSLDGFFYALSLVPFLVRLRRRFAFVGLERPSIGDHQCSKRDMCQLYIVITPALGGSEQFLEVQRLP